MARYIDANKMIDGYNTTFPYNLDFCDDGDLFDWVESQPTADVVEVRHGEWKRVRWVKCDDPDGGYWIVRCNQCSIPHFKEYNFCPSCGARMDGDEDDL